MPGQKLHQLLSLGQEEHRAEVRSLAGLDVASSRVTHQHTDDFGEQCVIQGTEKV